MIEMTDPRGKVTEYEYGAPSCGSCGGGGQLELVRDALIGETEWIYNSDGELETTIDAAGIETDYTYDDLGRLTTIEHPAGSTITSTITYNKLGQVASRTDFGGRRGLSWSHLHAGEWTDRVAGPFATEFRRAPGTVPRSSTTRDSPRPREFFGSSVRLMDVCSYAMTRQRCTAGLSRWG